MSKFQLKQKQWLCWRSMAWKAFLANKWVLSRVLFWICVPCSSLIQIPFSDCQVIKFNEAYVECLALFLPSKPWRASPYSIQLEFFVARQVENKTKVQEEVVSVEHVSSAQPRDAEPDLKTRARLLWAVRSPWEVGFCWYASHTRNRSVVTCDRL